jgi:hypothetical protein
VTQLVTQSLTRPLTQLLNRSVTQWVTVPGFSMTRYAYSMTRPKFTRYDTATVIDLGWSIKGRFSRSSIHSTSSFILFNFNQFCTSFSRFKFLRLFDTASIIDTTKTCHSISPYHSTSMQQNNEASTSGTQVRPSQGLSKDLSAVGEPASIK